MRKLKLSVILLAILVVSVARPAGAENVAWTQTFWDSYIGSIQLQMLPGAGLGSKFLAVNNFRDYTSDDPGPALKWATNISPDGQLAAAQGEARDDVLLDIVFWSDPTQPFSFLWYSYDAAGSLIGSWRGDYTVTSGLRGHSGQFTWTVVEPTHTPEPSALLLLGSGLVALSAAYRRRRRT